MNFAFLVSFFAGISTVFGCVVLLFKNDKKKLIGRCLAFAAGVMITVSFLDLIPSSITGIYKYFQFLPSILIVSIFFVIGVICSTIINKCLPSFEQKQDGKLYKLGIFSMLAIILHNVPEGIATYLTATDDIRLGISLALAIALHNIPEGISICVPIYFSTNSKLKAILYTFISGISEFLGALIAFIFLSQINSTMFLDLLYAIIAGIMTSLAVDELLVNALTYQNKISVIFNVLIGGLFMLIMHIFL